jgi:hypothetical protein
LVVATVLVAAVPALLPGSAAADPGDDGGSGGGAKPTNSRYMPLRGDAAAAQQTGYKAGCTDGRDGVSGLRVIFFGGQESGGKVRPVGRDVASPEPRVDESAVVAAANGWIKGFTTCGQATGVVALAVSNKPLNVEGSEAGARWAKVVERVAATAPANRISVAGGLDAEPGWGEPGWVRDWVDAFVRGNRMLINAGSADGCPALAGSTEGDPSGAAVTRPDVGPGAGLEPHVRLHFPKPTAAVKPGESCDNGWSVADAFHMSTGAGRMVYALPQIYRTDGIQARQWAGISRWGVKNGKGPLRVAGALSQQVACKQRNSCSGSGSKPGIDNSPYDARDQLTKALAGDPSTNISAPLAATDVAWPEADPGDD